MSEKLYEALEVCLSALETGADIGSVLKRFPDLKDELAPILETSQQARMLASPEVPEKAVQRGKLHVLQHANEMRMAAAARPRRRWAMFSFPRLAASLAIALVFVLSGSGLVRASTTALPGDNLYPVKRTWEDVRLTFSFDPEIREELEVKFEDERVHEIDELLGEGRHEKITFAGQVTEQNGDQWLVSGILVQIIADSNLPVETVSVGDSIIVEGHTNEQGYVEVRRVEKLSAGITLPSSVPAEVESHDESNQNGDFSIETEEYSNQDDLKINESSDDNENESDQSSYDKSKDEDNNKDSDGGDSSNDDHGGDNSHDNNHEGHGDHSGSGDGGDENDTGESH